MLLKYVSIQLPFQLQWSWYVSELLVVHANRIRRVKLDIRLLFGCETWTLKADQMERNEAAEMIFLKRLTRYILSDRRRREEIRGICKGHNMVKQLRFTD
jgi:hypothetical protein